MRGAASIGPHPATDLLLLQHGNALTIAEIRSKTSESPANRSPRGSCVIAMSHRGLGSNPRSSALPSFKTTALSHSATPPRTFQDNRLRDDRRRRKLGLIELQELQSSTKARRQI